MSRTQSWDAWNDAESRRMREMARRELLDDQLQLGKRMMKQAYDSMIAKAESDNPMLEAKDVPNYAKTGQALAAAALGLDAPGISPEQEAQNRMAIQAIQEAIDAADKETGDRVRANLYRLERERATRG